MKKICVMLGLCSMLFCCAFADELTDVGIIENELFGAEYKTEIITKRLERIEKFMFGDIQKGTTTQRISKIADTSGISFTPKKTAEQKRIAAADFMPEEKDVTYPVIDMLESKTFSKTYQGENVYKRLERLEQKAFGKTSEGDLSTRTDKLKAALLAVKPDRITYDDTYKPNTVNSHQNFENDFYGDTSNYYSYRNENKGYTTGGAANIDTDYGLSALENFVFGDTYAHLSSNDRLSKLERKLLNKTFDSDDINSRMERIAAVASAKGTSSQYNENKWAKYVSTGIQVGSILLMILAMIL